MTMYEIYEKLRDSKGVKDATVAKATGIGKSTFTDWKNGRSSPKGEKLQKIADYFGVPAEYLRTGKKKKFVMEFSRDALISALDKAEEEALANNPDRISIAETYNFINKITLQNRNDREEIMALIDLKLSRYKEKEKQDLA